MAVDAVSVAIITSIGPTLAGLAAWANARKARSQTNGVMMARFDRIDSHMDLFDAKLDRHIVEGHE